MARSLPAFVLLSTQNDIRRVTSAESEALREAFDRTQSELAAVTEKLTASERERKAAVKRAKECSDKLDGLTSELTFTKDLNASLTADQTGWKKQVCISVVFNGAPAADDVALNRYLMWSDG